jgi:hypothetical protein
MSMPAEMDKASGRVGLKVLYLPKGNRAEYFRHFLLHGMQHEGWRIGVPCQAAHKAAFKDITAGGGQCFALPDFTAPQDWESDPAAASALDARIAECERFSGVPANQLLLSGARNIGRGFSAPNHLTSNSRLARHALSDNMASARVLRRMFRFAFDLLDTMKPDVVIAGEWSSPLYYAIVLAARERGIRCAANRNSKIVSGRFFWTSDLSMFNGRSRLAAEKLALAAAQVSGRAREQIEAFRNQPKTLGYVGEKWMRRDRRGLLGSHLPYLRIFASQTLARLRGVPHSQPDPAIGMLVAQYRAAIMRSLCRGYFKNFSEEDLTKLRFVYFPLHKEGEVALTFQAPAWYDQANTVRQLSASLPAGYVLLVREHRSNHGDRPSRWYRELQRLPNVVLVDPFGSQFMFLRHAALVVTENGTSGWEASILDKPVLSLAASHYDGVDLAHYVSDPSELPAAMIELLSRPSAAASDVNARRIGWRIDAEYAHSFSGEVSAIPEAVKSLTAHCELEFQQ